jgi:hypothetical protein
MAQCIVYVKSDRLSQPTVFIGFPNCVPKDSEIYISSGVFEARKNNLIEFAVSAWVEPMNLVAILRYAVPY